MNDPKVPRVNECVRPRSRPLTADLEVDRAVVEQPQVSVLHPRFFNAVVLQDGIVELRGGFGQPPP